MAAATKAFAELKGRRESLFLGCVGHCKRVINQIYKELTRTQVGRDYLLGIPRDSFLVAIQMYTSSSLSMGLVLGVWKWNLMIISYPPPPRPFLLLLLSCLILLF